MMVDSSDSVYFLTIFNDNPNYVYFVCLRAFMIFRLYLVLVSGIFIVYSLFL